MATLWYVGFMPQTPGRHIRVPDELWEAAKTRAESEYRTVASVVIECLRVYAAGGGATVRPQAEHVVEPPEAPSPRRGSNGATRRPRRPKPSPEAAAEVPVVATDGAALVEAARAAKPGAAKECAHPGVRKKMRCPACNQYNV